MDGPIAIFGIVVGACIADLINAWLNQRADFKLIARDEHEHAWRQLSFISDEICIICHEHRQHS